MRAVVRAVLVAALLAAGPGLVACSDGGAGDGPLTEAELARILRDDHDLPAAQADCVAGQAFARLTDDERDLLRERDPDDEVPAELARKLRDAVTPCAGVR